MLNIVNNRSILFIYHHKSKTHTQNTPPKR